MDEFKSGARHEGVRDRRNITHKDIQKYQKKYLGGVPVRPPSYKSDISWMDIHYQHQTFRCSAHAGVHMKQGLDFADTGKNDYSESFLWWAIKQVDGLPVTVGSSMEGIMKALSKYGVCDMALCPSDYTKSDQAVADTAPTQEQLDNAQPRIINTNYAITYNPKRDVVKDAIFQNKYVVLLLRFDDNYFNHEYVDSNGTKIYGHFIMGYGYDDPSDSIYGVCSAEAVNKWKTLGANFSITCLGSAADLPDDYVRSLVKQRSLLQQIVELYRKLKALIK